MKIHAKFENIQQLRSGEGMAILKVENIRHSLMLGELETDKIYALEIKEARSKRSIEQNRLMWQLLSDIDIKINGKPTDEYAIYVMALEKANAKYDYIACLPEAERMLKENFRAVKFIKKVDLNGKEGNAYKCFIGSSKMDTKEMSLLIDTIFDIAEAVGVDTTYYDVLKGL